MTQMLSAHAAQVQQMRNLSLVAQGAVQERNAAVKQLSGLKQLTNELHQTQQDVLHYKDRANQYEMALLRTEAHLKKTKNALWDKQISYSELVDRIKSLEAENNAWVAKKQRHHSQVRRNEDIITDMSDSTELQVDSAPILDDDDEDSSEERQEWHRPQRHQRDTNTQERAIQVTPSPDDVAASVPRERHDKVLREVVRHKFTIQELAHKEGLHYKKVLQVSEYEDQITQLREELQTTTGELQRLKREIQHAKSSKDTGSQLLDTQLQLEKVSKANDMKQVLNETLASHIDELTSQLKQTKKELAQLKQNQLLAALTAESKPEDMKHTNGGQELQQPTAGDETDGKPVAKSSTGQAASKPKPLREDTQQQTAGDSIIAQPIDDSQTTTIDSQTEPMTQKRPQWEQTEKEMILDQQVKHLRDKVDRLSQDCKRLLTDKVMAIRDREVYETRYNDLMETVKQTKSSKTTACSTCRKHEQAIKKLQEEMENQKSEIEMVTAQKKLFEEDLEQEQLDAQQSKERFKSQIDSWRKNCVTLGKQVNLYKGDLERERKKIKTLEQKLALQQQATQMIQAVGAGRPFFTMQPGMAIPQPRSCASEIKPLINPFQEGYTAPGQLMVDGEGLDDVDGGDPNEYKSALTTLRGEGSGQKNECPRCKREFEAHEQEEFQKHVGKCLDNS